SDGRLHEKKQLMKDQREKRKDRRVTEKELTSRSFLSIEMGGLYERYE
ncbi:hypothetical protein CSUI_009171, partial [Cystoisospora suis]